MALAIVPIVMAVLGIIVWLWPGSAGSPPPHPAYGRGKEIARALFWAGFFGLAIAYATHMVHLG